MGGLPKNDSTHHRPTDRLRRAQTPLYAAALACVLLGEHFSTLSLGGVALFTLALAVASAPDAALAAIAQPVLAVVQPAGDEPER